MDPLLTFNGTLPRDPAIDAWLDEHPGALGELARQWFEAMRGCGDEVREVFHDGAANACLGEYPFAYVAIFTAHVNVGFFHGAWLRDPARLLQGSGKRMRHVKLKLGEAMDVAPLQALIESAWKDIKARVEHG